MNRNASDRLSFWKEKLKPKKETVSDAVVRLIPISEIHTDKALFQNRATDFSAESQNRILKAVERGEFKWEVFDAVLLWENQDKLYVLSGHSRLAAFKELSKNGVKVDGKGFDKIPAKIITVSKDEAIEIARNSNTLATKETEIDRARYYRGLRLEKKLKLKEIEEKASENEGKNARRVINLSYLNPDGFLIDALRATNTSDDKTRTTLEVISDWVGEVKRRFPLLSDSHEKELADWLLNEAYGTKAGQYSAKGKFLERVGATVQKNTEFGVFQSDKPLNLRRAASKNPTELEYERELDELREGVKTAEKTLLDKTREFYGGAADNKITKEKAAELLKPYQIGYSNAQNKLKRFLESKDAVMQQGKRQNAFFGIKKKFKKKAKK